MSQRMLGSFAGRSDRKAGHSPIYRHDELAQLTWLYGSKLPQHLQYIMGYLEGWSG